MKNHLILIKRLIGKKNRFFIYEGSVLIMFELLREIIKYFKRKKFWLIPVMIVLGIFGGLIVLTAGTAIAPFIYTIF